MLRKEIQKMGYKVVKIEPQIVQFTDLCPQCQRSGNPKIEKKDTADNRIRNWTYKEKRPPTIRPDEYWLVYSHRTKPKKCRIVQAVNTPYPSFKKNLRKDIDIRKYYFPYVVGLLKKKIGQCFCNLFLVRYTAIPIPATLGTNQMALAIPYAITSVAESG